jgi:dUTP pyrophosphatase
MTFLLCDGCQHTKEEMELYIAPVNNEVREFYNGTVQAYLAKPFGERDAGVDAFCEADVSAAAGETGKLSLGCRAAVYDTERKCFRAYWLLPRSSISKTPLRMSNSVGLIDAGYRGVLLGVVDFRNDYTAKKGERYFQITAPDLLPFKAVHIVDEIPGGSTMRGEGGFGSTGITTAAYSNGGQSSITSYFS